MSSASLTEALPASVRYVKNGAGGQWWKAARDNGQIHAGWRNMPASLILAADLMEIEGLIRAEFGAKPGATQDSNALRTLLDRPSQHLWVTFRDGRLWWCDLITHRLGARGEAGRRHRGNRCRG